MGKQICVSLDGVEVYENEEAYEVEQLKKHANWLEKELDKQRHKKASCQIHIGELEQLCRDMYHVIWGEDTSTKTCEMLRQRMEQLGLLDGEQK